MKEFMKKFSSWLNEKKIDLAIDNTNSNENETPEVEDEDVNFIGYSTFIKNGYERYLKEMEKIFGKIVQEKEINKNPAFKGCFFKDSKGNKLSIFYNSEAFKNASQSKQVNKVNNSKLVFTTKDGTKIAIYISNKSVAESGNQFFIDKTEMQECFQAIIIERLAKNEGFKIKNKKSTTPFYDWCMESDASKKTNLFKYLKTDVSIKTEEQFKDEFKHFYDEWGESFESLINSKIIEKINSVFVKGTPNWSKLEVLHPNKKTSVSETIMEDYFSNAGQRCGKRKDTVDKSDILLAFGNNPQKFMEDILAFKTEEDLNAHNNMLNEAILNKEYIGVSLKKNSGNVQVSAVNIRVGTTAIGDGINEDAKIIVKYYGPGNKKNTIGEIIKPQSGKKDAVTYSIYANVNHPEDIHLETKPTIICKIKGNKKLTAPKIYFDTANSDAQLGSGKEWIIKYTDEINQKFDTLEKFNKYKPKFGAHKAYLKLRDELYDLYINNPGLFEKILAANAGYPLEISLRNKKKDYIIVSAPYLKIF